MKLTSRARFSTVCLHAGQEPDPATGAIVTPIYQTSTYVQQELGRHKGYEYGRTQNPTRMALERNLAAIEGGQAGFAFASGMAAIGAIATMLRSGDHVIVSDTIWVSRDRPACPAGLRGLQGFTLTLEVGETDQHSGVTGGAARNPIGELMKLVSQMYDAESGDVKIKGFYDDVAKPSRKELDDFRKSGFSVSAFKKDHLFRSIRTNKPLEVMKRIWAMPTFEVHGLVGGYTGPGIKTIIPPRAEVKISCRLVPNQDPKKIIKLVQKFVKKHNPDVKVTIENSMYPYLAPTTGPLADAVKSAMKFAFGREPVFVREGGSIGAVNSMEKVLECPVMFLGLSLPEHGYHAPNENYDWQQASGGMVAFAKYFENVASL